MRPKRNLDYNIHIKLGPTNNTYGENKVPFGGSWRPWVARFFLTHVMN